MSHAGRRDQHVSFAKPHREEPSANSMQLELFNPHRAGLLIDLADALLKKWNIEAAREETWRDLQNCIHELGPACDWQLPARVSLVASIIQLAENLEKAHISLAARRWLLKVRSEKQTQKFDALGLLSDLNKCLESSESSVLSDPLSTAEKSALARITSDSLENDVVSAASLVSSQLDYQSLEDRHMYAIKAKEFALGRLILEELEKFWKFLQISAPMSKPQSVPMSKPQPRDSMGMMHIKGEENTLNDLLENGRDHDDTLEDMLELGGEDEDLEDVATPTSQTPQPPLHLRQTGPMLIGKRKAEVTGSMDLPQSSARMRQSPATPSSSVSSISQHQVVPVSPAMGSRVSPSSLTQARRTSDLFTSALPDPGFREERVRWSTEEEEKLMQGFRHYGNRWEFIRTQCGLKHKTGAQMKDKIRNLKKHGRV